MARFNRYLRGLLGFLDGKVGGLTPAEFADFLQPTLDSYPFLHAQQRELVRGGSAGIGTGGEGFDPIAALLVPQDEVWLVDWACAYMPGGVFVGAADQLTMQPAVTMRSAGAATSGMIVLGNMPWQDPALAWCPHSTSIRPYIALPNDQFGIWVDIIQLAAGTVQPNLDLLIVRCKV